MEYNQLICIQSSPKLSRQGRPGLQLLRGLCEGKERKLFPQSQHESEKKRPLEREEGRREAGRTEGREGGRKGGEREEIDIHWYKVRQFSLNISDVH